MSDDQLKHYFKFDDNDLFENQHGRLSAGQQQRLIKEEKSANRWFRIIGIGLIIIGLVPYAVMLAVGASASSLLPWVCWPLAWGGVGVILLIASRSSYSNALKKTQGPINIVKTESHDPERHTTNVYYEMHVGGETFDVDSKLADIMLQGDVYVIYYCDDPQEILSAQKVRAAEAG